MNEAHIQRVIRGVTLTSAVGVLTVVTTFFVWHGGLVDLRVASLLFLAATLLIGGGVLLVAAAIPYIPWVTPMLVTGAVLAMVAMVLEVLDDYAFSAGLPIIGRYGLWHMPHFDDGVFFTGMGIIVCCAYLAILDAALGRVRLSAESEEKSLAIQEAQRYAQALARSERIARDQLAEIHHLYNAAPAGLCFVDSQLRCHRVNQYFARLDGVTVRAHLGQPITLAVPIVGGQLAEWCAEALRTSMPRHHAELSFPSQAAAQDVRGSGRRTWLVNIIPVHMGNTPGGVQLVVQDITVLRAGEEARRELAAQVQQAQKARSLGVLAAGVAHDFNNLLTGILGNTSLLLRELKSDERSKRLLEAIVRSAERSAELTGQMLAYSGHGVMEARPVAIDLLVREATPLLENAVGEWGDLQIETAAEACTVLGDGVQLRQALVNLVTNAAEALGTQGGVVTVRTGSCLCGPMDLAGLPGYETPAAGDYAVIEVSDNGSGMDSATLTAIFDPFYSTKFTGRGLGLAVVLGVARHHKGVIGVTSVPGEGSRFRLLIPVLGRPALKNTPLAAQMPTRDGSMVLIIDDEEAVRGVAGEITADMGYVPIPAANGEEGVLRYLEFRDQVKAVLLDLSMPGMDGRATFQALRAEGCEAPIIVVSGYSEDQTMDKGSRSFDYFRFVQKPFTYEGLCHVLREAMGAQD
jgi:signal transduction histidine kinase